MGYIKNLLLTEPPAYAPHGMTVDQFAEAQSQFADYARSRIYRNSEHYDYGDSQRMESLSVPQVITELREEIADAVNYLVGLDIIVSRLFVTQEDWELYGIAQGWLADNEMDNAE